MVILSVRFLWRARTWGISLFSIAHGRWRSHPGQPAQAAYTEHAQFVDVSRKTPNISRYLLSAAQFTSSLRSFYGKYTELYEGRQNRYSLWMETRTL